MSSNMEWWQAEDGGPSCRWKCAAELSGSTPQRARSATNGKAWLDRRAIGGTSCTSPMGNTIGDMSTLSSRCPNGQIVNAFLSFSTDDHRSASLFDHQMSCAFTNFQLLGQPLTNRYERDWQRQCNEKIQDSAFLICLVGGMTYRSAAVAWEIGRAIELSKPVLPVALHARTERLPPILRENSIPPVSCYNCLVLSDVFSRIFELTK